MLMPVRSYIPDIPEVDRVLARHDEVYMSKRGRLYSLDIGREESYPDWSDEEWKEYETSLRGYKKEQKIQAISLIAETLKKVGEIKEKKHELRVQEIVRMRTQAIMVSSNINHPGLNGKDAYAGYSLDEIYVSLWQCALGVKKMRQKGLRQAMQDEIDKKMKVLHEQGDTTPLEDILSYVIHDMTEGERMRIISDIRQH